MAIDLHVVQVASAITLSIARRSIDRAGLYGEAGYDYADNHIRFGLLNQAALGIARDIFQGRYFSRSRLAGRTCSHRICCALAGDPTFFGVKSVLTIHNLGYQGIFPPASLNDLGLDRSLFHMEGLEFFGDVSMLKAGIVCSDAVTTVSPTYAKEIQTPEYGFGFDGLLRSRAYKLTGILNGVDYREWDPRNDPHIAAPYSADDLDRKSRVQAGAAGRKMGLAQENRPLIGIVSRFASQKGLDIFMDDRGGSGGGRCRIRGARLGRMRLLRDAFRGFAQRRPDKFGVRIGYDNGLAHRIEAGADMFLMPSRYEPSGLSQMYSLRYGTVPIVRATGGLDDTVDEETGFKFHGYSPEALLASIRAALAAYRERSGWTERMRLGMAKDFSWGSSAAKYQRALREIAELLTRLPQRGATGWSALHENRV